MKKIIYSLCLILVTAILTYFLKSEPYRVHYHANMMVMIDGKEWDFDREIYMEEVSRCNVTIGVRPEDRIHLHENKGDLLHVHMAASTWGDLFSNLMWNFGSGYLVDDYGKMYQSGSGKSVYYILNGEVVNNPHNTPVASEDKLLIWYGSGISEDILTRYFPLVSGDAREYNNREDPASCSANEQSEFFAPITDLWAHIREYLPHTHEAGQKHDE